MQKRPRATHPWLRQDSWTLWEWWVLATVVGGLVGIGIAGLVSFMAGTFGITNSVMLLHVVTTLQGMTLGFSQWLVLRRYIKHVGGWVLATAMGAIIAWLIGLKVIVALTLIFSNSALFETIPSALLQAIFCLGAWMGAVLGLAQWFVLRTHVRKGLIWVLANALAWGLGLVVMLIGVTLTKPGEFSLESNLIGVATGATTGFVVGAITGAALVWLLKSRLLKHH